MLEAGSLVLVIDESGPKTKAKITDPKSQMLEAGFLVWHGTW
jgi:hypothetical protein